MAGSLEQLKQTIREKIRDAKQHGVDDRTITEGIVNFADVAFNYEAPESREEALIKELWNIANNDEKLMLAGLVRRMAEQT